VFFGELRAVRAVVSRCWFGATRLAPPNLTMMNWWLDKGIRWFPHGCVIELLGKDTRRTLLLQKGPTCTGSFKCTPDALERDIVTVGETWARHTGYGLN
jgi:hypothetical protein